MKGTVFSQGRIGHQVLRACRTDGRTIGARGKAREYTLGVRGIDVMTSARGVDRVSQGRMQRGKRRERASGHSLETLH